MTKTFTQDDLIRYYYKEFSEEERQEIESALICDPKLQERFKELSSILSKLDEACKEPSDRVVKSIMKYSKSLNLHSIK